MTQVTIMHQAPVSFTRLVLLAACLVPWPAQAQTAQTLTVKRDTEVRKQPDASAESIMPIAASSTVLHHGERQGAWMRIKADTGKQGWMRLFDLSATSTAASTSGGGGAGNVLRGVGSLLAPGSSKPVTTSTLGVRGLDANDVATAQPNPAAVTQGERLRTSEAQAKQFAQRSGLTPRQVAELPDSAAPATPGGTAN
jgi:hypothetical protein